MLTNKPIRPVDHDLDRHWISDEYFDLIVWYEADGHIYGFQLCYDKPDRERALTWTRDKGFLHTTIEPGESKPTANRTPILIVDGTFPARKVTDEFIVRSASLPAAIRELVLTRIDEYEARQRLR